MRVNTAVGLFILSSIMLCGTLHSAFGQGSLTPPGAPSPTMKTLAQIEPRMAISSLPTTITQLGSYYLTGNLTGESGQNGIVVAADNVSIDLSGFTLKGGDGSLSGVSFTGGRQNVSLRNGKIASWGQWGVDAIDTTNTLFIDLQILNNGIGFRARANALVERCQAYGNSEIGFSVGRGSRIQSCLSQKNTNRGFYLGENSSIADSTAVENSTEGIFLEQGGGVVSNCIAAKNGANGIKTGPNSSVTGCVAEYNQFHGFSIGEAGRISDSTSHYNGNDGFALSRGAEIAHCTSSRNGADGFYLNDGATITQCTANSNTGNGITMTSCCVALDNNVMFAGYGSGNGAGIYIVVGGYANRIEGNSVTNGDRGIQVVTGGNLIIRNSASSNTDNYGTIAAGNTVGPIVTSANIGTSNNPHANYQF